MARAEPATIARLLREFGQYTALEGGSPYRAKAYLRAAENFGIHAFRSPGGQDDRRSSGEKDFRDPSRRGIGYTDPRAA